MAGRRPRGGRTFNEGRAHLNGHGASQPAVSLRGGDHRVSGPEAVGEGTDRGCSGSATEIGPASDGRRPRLPEIAVSASRARAGARALGCDGRGCALPIAPGLQSVSALTGGGPQRPLRDRRLRSVWRARATSHAGALPSGLGAWLSCVGGCCSALRWPGASSYTREPKTLALAVLSSDALSSIAYGRKAMSAILSLAGSGALGLSLPIALATSWSMVAVGFSYRRLIRAYPTAAAPTPWRTRSRRAARADRRRLLIDCVLTVTVSFSSGIAAITSALPAWPARPCHRPGVIALLLAGNLRGVRQAGVLFSAPTHAFVRRC